FEIDMIPLHSSRKARWIENRTYYQGHFDVFIGARLETNNARHETVGRRAPGYSALGNSKDNLKDTLLFVAVRMPCVRKVCLINSFYISQRRDEFGEIFNARPLFIRFADGRLYNDGMSRCVHFDRGRIHRLCRVVRWRTVHTSPSKKPGSVRR